MAQAINLFNSLRSQLTFDNLSNIGVGTFNDLCTYAKSSTTMNRMMGAATNLYSQVTLPDAILVTTAVCGAFALLGLYACCCRRREPTAQEIAHLDQTLDSLFTQMITNEDKDLNKLCGKNYRNAFASFLKLGGAKRLPEQFNKLQLLKEMLDKGLVESADVELYHEVIALKQNVTKISSRVDFSEDAGTFAALHERLQNGDLSFNSIIASKLEEVRGRLDASPYSRKGLNRALDALFVDIPFAESVDSLIERKEELLALFEDMVHESGDRKGKFQTEFSKFELLRIILETKQPNPAENQLFHHICVLQGTVKKIQNSADFKAAGLEFKALLAKANSAHFAFESVIDGKLEEIKQALMASPFYKKKTA
ncbi:MAG TPA: hypothetical protein VLG44_01810 [Chlamydiales bacterium]|nr:hypothetical protein [Chlamydiales bacterium]